ncbi:MAG TPA: M1 family aminopeptidase, partial [Cytophagales bacterium]
NYRLRIGLGKTYTRSTPYTLTIDYTARPNELPAGGSEAITSDKGLYFINADGTEPGKPRQLWTQGETEANSRWFPTIDSPNERCTQEVYLTVDPKYVTLSNGSLVYSRANKDGTRTDYWKQDQPHAPYLFMIAAGDFAVVKDKWQNLEVNYYVEPGYAKYAKAIFGRTPEMIEFFSKKLNYKFPWEKYSQIVVRDFVSGAMENTTAVTFYDKVLMDHRDLVDENSDNIIAHELFHHWFGDLVTTESWANLPLNESFANYSEYLWQEHKNGLEEADYHAQTEADQYFAEAENKQEPLIRYRYLDKEDMFDSHSYAKGGRILHMLRKYVGDDAFFTALNLYLTTHKYTSVEIHDLRLAFEEVTGEDLNWFFNQWFLAAGHPDLLVTHNYADGKVRLTVKQRQDSLYTPIYRLPVKVGVWTGGKLTTHAVDITRAEQTVELPAAARPDLVLFDAETQLLGKTEHPKSKEELVFQYYNTDRYLSRYEAFNGLFEVVKAQAEEEEEASAASAPKASKLDDPALRKLATDALGDKFWVIRQMAVRNLLGYQGEEAAGLGEKLRVMALRDPRSYVRAEAINTLLSWPGQQGYQPLYEKALSDSSYSVAAVALNAYLSTNPADAAEKINQFRNYKNNEVRLTIGNYYAAQADPAYYDWFKEQLTSSDEAYLYQMVQLFGQYLLNQPAAQQTRGVEDVGKLALEATSEYVRFSAYQTLSMFKDVAGVKEKLQQIRARETDPKLKELYELMPVE